MEWFKILLLVIFGVSTILNFVDVGKGEYQRSMKPVRCAIAGFVGIFFIIGIIMWL